MNEAIYPRSNESYLQALYECDLARQVQFLFQGREPVKMKPAEGKPVPVTLPGAGTWVNMPRGRGPSRLCESTPGLGDAV